MRLRWQHREAFPPFWLRPWSTAAGIHIQAKSAPSPRKSANHCRRFFFGDCPLRGGPARSPVSKGMRSGRLNLSLASGIRLVFHRVPKWSSGTANPRSVPTRHTGDWNALIIL